MSTGDSGHEPVELYGIIEIASALGVDRRKVAVWHGRGKLPPADYRASGRPFWKPETITPWLATQTRPQHATAPNQANPPPHPTPASSPATPAPAPRPRPRRRAPSAEPARPASRARGRRAPTQQDAGGEDPYELVRGGQGWTLTYLGEPIGTVRPAWSVTGRSKRWAAHGPSGMRLDARTYPTVKAAAVQVAMAHRQAAQAGAGRRR